jgi:putative heme-binding domain-containing protein
LTSSLARCSDEARRAAAELLTGRTKTTQEQAEQLDELVRTLPTGDIRRGQAVFNSAKAACSTCHAIGYLGGNFGPDLTRIGQVRNERDLLEAIVFPSASFVRSYEPVLVTTKSDIHNGILRGDNATELVLATGPTTEVRLPRGEIAATLPGTVSPMPQGYDQILSAQELADLVAFLRASR